jgi:hypothetical protein
MATYNKFRQFVEDVAEKVHNLGADALTIALTATANAPVNTNTVLANLTQISYTNLSARVPSISASLQTAGTYKLTLADLVLTAGGGAVAAFQYIVLYNDTPTSPADPLIGWWDYGSALTLADTETLTLNFDDANGVLQIA